jgi:hypothetical protein
MTDAGTTHDQVAVGTRYNRLAIAALVMAAVAALGVFFFGVAVLAVFAVGAGHVALNQIKVRGERGRGLAMAALMASYAMGAWALVLTISYAISAAAQQLQ